MTERHILTAQNCQHPDATTQVAPKGNGWREHRATCQHCRCTFSMHVKSPTGKEIAPIRMAAMEQLGVYDWRDLETREIPPWVLQEIFPGEKNPSIKIYGAWKEIERVKP